MKQVTAPIIVSLIVTLAALGTGCKDKGASTIEPAGKGPAVVSAPDPGPIGNLAIIYPRNNTVFPPEAVPPRFRWTDDTPGVATWTVTVRCGAAPVTAPSGGDTHWTPSEEQWVQMKAQSLQTPCSVVVEGQAGPGRPSLSRQSMQFTTSSHGVDASIFYREVNLPFIEAIKDPSKIRWRYGAISSREQPPVVLENLPVCGNCHSFSADGKVMGMDVDYANDKGSYVIAPVEENTVLNSDRVITWSDYKRDDGKMTFGLLSQVSPDGRYVVSTVKDRSVFVPRDDLEFSQLFFPVSGILVVYDRETNSYSALPGADDPDMVQSNPTWSPDGTTIIFARAPAVTLPNLKDPNAVLLAKEEALEFIEGRRKFLFDLYSIPFNKGAGGTAIPLKGAFDNGKSNFFAKFSPDGKWIVYTQAGSYMLLQPDSELFIIPATGGEARRLECNTSRMNSWHSWSPNGHWLLFSSKELGPYTQLFIAAMDEDGNCAPPVLLEHFTASDRAANIPEFVNRPPEAIVAMREEFLDDYSFVRAAAESATAGDMDQSMAHLKTALKLAPENVTAHNRLGKELSGRGQPEEAMEHFMEAVRLAPEEAAGHLNMALELVRAGDMETAQGHYIESVRLSPESVEAQSGLGMLLTRSGQVEEALPFLKEAVRLAPDRAEQVNNYGYALAEGGRFEEALAQFESATRLDPELAQGWNNLGMCLAQLGRVQEAAPQFARAVELAPDDPEFLNNLGLAYLHQSQIDKAISSFNAALELAPEMEEAKANLELAKQGVSGENADIAELENRVSANSNDADAHFALARARAHQHDLSAATPHFAAAARLRPEDPFMQFEYGMVLAASGQDSHAVELFEGAIALAPANALFHDALGRSLLRIGRTREALASHTRAVELAPDNPVARNDLGRALMARNQPDKAAEQFEKALELAPDYEEARNNLQLLKR